MGASRGRLGRAEALPLLLLGLVCGAPAAWAQETRAYRSLWSGLFKQQAPAVPASRDATGSPAAAAPSDALLRALADAHAWLHPGANASGGGPPSLMHPGGLEDWVGHYLGDLSSLLPGLLPERGGGGEPSLLQRLHDLPADALNRTGLDAGLQQQVATLAAVQAWALVTLLAHGASGTGGAGGGDGGGGSALPSPGGLTAGSFSSSLDMNLVQDPSWASFKPHTCIRLQNFGNGEGYHAALFGAAPCGGGPFPAPAAHRAAVSSDALRWGAGASLLLDCSKGGGPAGVGGSGSTDAHGGGASSPLTSALAAAASKVQTSVAAAFDTTRTCRLALSTHPSPTDGDSNAGGGAGSGALLEHSFEQSSLFGPKLDALRVRICNTPPSTLQYPAALAHGTTVSLANLKLNGRPLLGAPLALSQAAAAEGGCLAQLYRLPSKATKAGFVLSGWVALEGASAFGGGGGTVPAAGFGPGEMSSVELTLGEYSLLDAATSRLLGGMGAPQAQHPPAAGAAQPQR